MLDEPEPPVEIYTDELGRTVRRFPPAYSNDLWPGPTALPKGHFDPDE